MKYSQKWLEEYIDLSGITPQELAEKLTAGGAEVEGIEGISFPFQGVISAEVRSTRPHPNADKLKLVTIFNGQETLEIVCGAPEVAPGMIVAFAPVGATVGDLTMREAKIRGIPSAGMLCACSELGIERSPDVLMQFPEGTPLGKAVDEILFDPIYDVFLTPDLGHLRSFLGMARECSALLDRPYTFEFPAINDENETSDISILIDKESGCSAFYAKVVTNVTDQPSPEWMQERLLSAGLSPKNLIVDVTNYVMILTGQPLHAFDYDKLEKKELVVTQTEEKQKLVTLDNVTREIPACATTIACNGKTIALAGIMGGQSTAVTEKTQTILLEAAHFASTAIRKTSRLMDLRTDASIRFEYESDPLMPEKAIEMAACLLTEHMPQAKAHQTVSRILGDSEQKTISLELAKVNQILGTSLSDNEIEEILSRLDIRAQHREENTFTFAIPSYRNDLQLDVDLIDEVIRIYGYDHLVRPIPTLKASTKTSSPIVCMERKVREKCVALGLNEWLTCPLISPDLANLEIEHGLFSTSYLKVLYAKSSDQSCLRVSLLPSLIESLQYNLNHFNKSASAFEIGKIFFKTDRGHEEKLALGILLYGNAEQPSAHAKPRPYDFYDLKGILDALLTSCGVTTTAYRPTQYSTFHPYQQSQVFIDGNAVGVFGQIHPSTSKALDMTQPLFFAEILLEPWLENVMQLISYEQLCPYPPSTRDWTCSASADRPLGELFEKLQAEKDEILHAVDWIDLYQDPSKDTPMKSATFRLTYLFADGTLSQEQVDKRHNEVIEKVLASWN